MYKLKPVEHSFQVNVCIPASKLYQPVFICQIEPCFICFNASALLGRDGPLEAWMSHSIKKLVPVGVSRFLVSAFLCLFISNTHIIGLLKLHAPISFNY